MAEKKDQEKDSLKEDVERVRALREQRLKALEELVEKFRKGN